MNSKRKNTLTKSQRKRFDKVIENNLEQILAIEGVISFGVGFKTTAGVATEEICLVVHVAAKRPNVPHKRRIPDKIDGIKTDVVELMPDEDEGPFPYGDSAVDAKTAPRTSAEPMPEQNRVETAQIQRQEMAHHSPQQQLEFSDRPVAQLEELMVLPSGPIPRGFRWTDSVLRVPNSPPCVPLVAGIPIQNPSTGRDHVGVLGAIVFHKDKNQAMGLSVQHAIGHDGDPDKTAKPGDAINQPPRPPCNQIGTLLKISKAFDAAVFSINDGIDITPKRIYGKPASNGKRKDIKLGEPIKADYNMKVECPARFGHATGVVRDIQETYAWDSNKMKLIKTIYIEFTGDTFTEGGDSGAVWVMSSSSETKKPIGLHRGIRTFRNRDGSTYKRAYASCMIQLADEFSFSFTKPKGITPLPPNPGDSQTDYVETKSGFVGFCFAPNPKSLVIKNFDEELKPIGNETQTGIAPHSAVAAGKHKQTIYAVWRSSNNNRLNLAKYSRGSLETPELLKYESLLKPAIASFKKELVIAYTDATSKQIKIRYRNSVSKRWRSLDIPNSKSKFGPALIQFGDYGLVVCWVQQKTNAVHLADLWNFSNGKPFRVFNYEHPLHNDKKYKAYQAKSAPSLAVHRNKLCLAFLDQDKVLQVLECTPRYPLKDASVIDLGLKNGPPTLVSVKNRLICCRT